MTKSHLYTTQIAWTGNTGEGNKHYRGYERTWDMAAPGKPRIACSNDPVLGGDASKYNPEDLLLAAVASCHMLWYLHLASDAGVLVSAYEDAPEAEGEMEPDGTGRFLSATLRPRITVAAGTDLALARALHDEIHKHCFVARSVNFPIRYAPEFTEA